jgi:hypothetical protein
MAVRGVKAVQVQANGCGDGLLGIAFCRTPGGYSMSAETLPKEALRTIAYIQHLF